MLLLAVVGCSAFASTYTVTNLNDSGARSLRQAIDDANANAGADTIDFAAGVTGTIVLTSGALVLEDDATILGPGADVLAVSGNNHSLAGFVVLAAVSVAISDLTITDATNGIVCNGSVTMTDCVIPFNGVPQVGGSGMANSGDATPVRCTLLSNVTSGTFGVGGGISNASTATLQVTDSVFSGNKAQNGGAINNTGILKVTDSTFLGNTADEGGAINTDGPGAVVTAGGCTFAANSATVRGGAILATNGSPAIVTNCTFSDNSASGLGGALAVVLPSVAELTHCTLFSNSAGQSGGAVEAEGGIVLLNTPLANSAPENVHGAGPTIDHGGNFDSDGSAGLTDITDIFPTGSTPLDPELGPLQDNGGPTFTHALLPGSPYIDAALASTVDVDQRGIPRPQDGDGDGVFLPDIGAYEMQPADLSIGMGATPSTVKGRKRLTYTITVKNFGPGASTNVVVTDVLPSGTGFAAASAKANGVALPPSVLQTPAFGARGTVVADLGDMAFSDADTVVITVDVFVRKTTISNTATVTSDAFDPDAANNAVTVTTVIK